jgi:hypothetical protein
MTQGGYQPQAEKEGGPELPPPPWYTADWPKNCQYNQPDCTLYEMDTSNHKTAMHKDMVRNTDRWKAALTGQEASIRLSFTSLTDEDVQILLEAIRHSETVTEIDLSHNDVADIGVQHLVAALCDPAVLPSLQTVRLYKNKLTALGESMVKEGLSAFRPKLKVLLEPPLSLLEKSG